nr:protein FAR-RED ELONGATED HYPOCOTYL 3-like [Aegilops tauschii subsp. strangulata]
MNHVLKKGFVKRTQNLHKFARVNACIQTRMQKENEQTMTSMTNPVTKITYGYEEDMSIKYTRAVYTKMRTRMRKATLFRAKPTAEPTKYLVYYHNKAGHDDEERFSRSKHEFQVVADPKNEIYKCQCKLWTHTGLFCHHIMNILDYLKPDKFPHKYVLKWYTKTAKSQPTFDTRDYNTTASGGSSRLSKQDILLQLNLMVNKKAMRYDQQYDRAFYVLKRLVEELDAIHSANRADSDERMAEEDAEIEDDLHYYAAEMLNAAAQANHCKQGVDQLMQQRQQETMKLPLYYETKGRKKISAAKKSDKRAQIKVAGHNKLTCPTLLERNNAEEFKQPKVQKQRPKVIEQKNGPHPQKASSRLCRICKEYEPHNARTCPKRADAEKTSKKPEKKQKAKPRASNKKVVEDEEEDEDEDTIEEEEDEVECEE